MTARPNAAQKAKLSGPAPTKDFVYTAPGGGTITLPPMGKALDAEELRQFRKRGEGNVEMFYYILERDNPDEDDMAPISAVLKTMSIDEDLPDLIQQWQEFSKASAGESSAS